MESVSLVVEVFGEILRCKFGFEQKLCPPLSPRYVPHHGLELPIGRGEGSAVWGYLLYTQPQFVCSVSLYMLPLPYLLPLSYLNCAYLR